MRDVQYASSAGTLFARMFSAEEDQEICRLWWDDNNRFYGEEVSE